MTLLPQWTFTAGAGPQRLREDLAAHGGARLRVDAPLDVGAPWAFAEALLGARPAMVERQIIRPVAHGRSFASSAVEAPWHTDSQCFFGVAPDVQVMRCVRASGVGGESLYLDTWPLLDRLAREDPALYRAVFSAVRRMPFVFGDVVGPTVSLRRGRMVFTQSPQTLAGDAVGEAVDAWLARAEHTEFRAEAGDVTVIDNHRVLHGRRAFEDRGREFVRVLIWLSEPLPRHRAHHALAARSAAELRGRLGAIDASVAQRFGLGDAVDPDVRQRADAVVDMLRGLSPGMIAARLGVPEPRLYQWRDAFVAGAEQGLAAEARDAERAQQGMEEAWRRLRGPR